MKRVKMTPAGLIAEIRAARNEWENALKGLSDVDFETAEISRGWSLKDVLGHLATYLRLNVRHLEAFTKRGRIASMRAENWYRFNRREVARLNRAPIAQLRANFDSAFDDLLLLLPRLDEEDLVKSFPSPWSQNTSRKVRLGTILRGDVSRHLREHARDVRKWRANENR